MATNVEPVVSVDDVPGEASVDTTNSVDPPAKGENKLQTEKPPKTATKEGSSRKLNLKMSFRTLSSPKKADKDKEKDKNEPSRFLGEGVSFKAKLIGILEVSEARGDRMCQEALGDLKMAIRAAGEHKQRITINIAIDGLRLRDEKTGDCLYHHPVHKISFIAQDMSDSRAFGYIFGSPDTGHRFFGIKTDKAASQVVIAMRDLFQVVFELKKKEIEMAKQHIEQHQIKLGGGGLFMDSGSSSKTSISSSDQAAAKMRTIQEDSVKENGTVASANKSAQQTSEVIADLLDLEFELNSIQQGIHQMERITPSDPFGPGATKEDQFITDPFGDSFTPTTIPPPPKVSRAPSVTILPPPPSSTRSSDPFHVPPPARHINRRGAVRKTSAEKITSPPRSTKPPAAQSSPAPPEKHWFDQETESLFEEGELVTPPIPPCSSLTGATTVPPLVDQVSLEIGRSPPTQQPSNQFDVFTELDPLGTGRSKPYIDRKDFFQELKNPPKKVLKDLVTETPSEGTVPLFQANFETSCGVSVAVDSVVCQPVSDKVSRATDATAVSSKVTKVSSTTSDAALFPVQSVGVDSDPFADTDPFDKTDPFAEDDDDDFANINTIPNVSRNSDPFDTGFADFTMFDKGSHRDRPKVDVAVLTQSMDVTRRSPLLQSESSTAAQPTFHGPLRVSLPPEKTSSDVPVALPPLPTSSGQTPNRSTPSPSATLTKTRSRTSRLHKQVTMSGMVRLPSPKSSQRPSNRLSKQMTIAVCSSNATHTLNKSPTPPTPSTPPQSENNLDGFTLRNRCAVTPSPPTVACFPSMSEPDSASRLSGSSAELSEIAPEPPPRPTTNISAIKPPPLPPKRQQVGCVVKPPPRPPHSEEHPHYDYIENYETSISPTPQETEEAKTPPIPVPARRPRFQNDFDLGTVPHHLRRQPSPSKVNDDYLPPFPLLPPPQRRSPAVDSRNTSTFNAQPSPNTTVSSFLQSTSTLITTQSSEEHVDKSKSEVSSIAHITLSQLTSAGLGELAATLGVSPGQLSNMTLQELTTCLTKLSASVTTNQTNGKDIKNEEGEIKRDKYATLRESVDEEPPFKAEFEANFENTTDKSDDVFQDSSFDKYAVFRELIEEKIEEKTEEKEEPVPTTVTAVTIGEDSVERNSEPVTLDTSLPDTSQAEAQNEDRYAALREISLIDSSTEKEETDTFSDKEESTAELSKIDEENSLISLSRQPSDSTESPTIEVTTVRVTQSIIETTIMEEDLNALEADNTEAHDEATESPEKDKKLSSEFLHSNDGIDNGLGPTDGVNSSTSTPSEKEEINEDVPSTMGKEGTSTPTVESWAKFDTSNFISAKPSSEVMSEGGVSPWSSDGKEFRGQAVNWQEPFDREQDHGIQRRSRRSAPWREDEESEEGWEERRKEEPWSERQWRENGWSDGESFYEDVPPVKDRIYHKERRGRRRRVSPWKGQRSSRDVSPWEQEAEEEHWRGGSKRWQDRSIDDEEEEEEYEVAWKTRPKQRGSSWDDERRKRYAAREFNGVDYEEARKRRPSPWKDDERRGSWESASWDEEDRFSQREYGSRRMRADRDEDYRRRWDPEMDRCYGWARRSTGPEGMTRHKWYYRDRSRESPWEDEYSEHVEDESPRYPNRKRGWQKRPSSASEVRRTSEKGSPGDYKVRGTENQHTLPAAIRMEMSEKPGGYGFPEWKYRDKGAERPRSREGHFNSDQEYEYWPRQERPMCRMDRDIGYEQRSQTLHSRRAFRYRKSHDRGFGQKSPFDDDFSTQAFELATEVKNQAGDSDLSDSVKQKSPVTVVQNENVSLATTPTPGDVGTKRKDMPPDLELRSKDVVLSNAQDNQVSPTIDEASKARASRGSSQRQSPFEDDFTPPETRHASIRLASSVSSDISDYPKSPFEDTRGTCRVESVVEETGFESETEQKNNKSYDDVFLPADNNMEIKEGEQKFADFESNMFSDNFGDSVPCTKTPSECKRVDMRISGSTWSSEECNKSDRYQTGMRLRMSTLKADSSPNIRKSESVNIFARENDPFDDDFFSTNAAPHLPRSRIDNGQNSDTTNTGDPFKWTKAFDSFNFEEVEEEN